MSAARLPVVEHCDGCLCDKTSPQAIAFGRTQVDILPSDSRWFCRVTQPEALAAIMAWYRGSRGRAGKGRAKLRLVLVAHQDQMEVRTVTVKAYRKRKP